jgi:excisionase family DNA binding protein
MGEDSELPKLAGYLTVKEIADKLGISQRMVHNYIQDGRLPGSTVGHLTIVSQEDFQNFQRTKRGRSRKTLAIWRKSVGDDFQQLTHITVRVRPGQGRRLEAKLEEIRAGGKHLLPGTIARYIVRGEEKPDEVQIVLVWRNTVMPSAGEREAALAALRAELAEILDWEHAVSEHGRVIMHT